MCRKRFTFEFDGVLDPDYKWRDNLYYLLSLQVKDFLNFHSGCVNTIAWDEPGDCLLSGSDDRQIAITRLFSSRSSQKGDIVFSQKLPADSNIFSAKFLPYTSISQIVVGFKCGCVLFVQPEAPPDSRIQVVHCHGYAVSDVLPLPDLPHCFLTLSHDHSVMCFDTRVPFGYRSNRQFCNQRCTYPGYRPISSQPSGLFSMKFQFPVTAGDVHPLDGSRRIALGYADGFVRLFDLRNIAMSRFSSADQGAPVEPVPIQVTRPIGLPARLAERRAIRLDYGPSHITSVQFEPLYPMNVGRIRIPTVSDRSVNLTGLGGHRLLVSHMYAPVFLFDLRREELLSATTSQVVDWLPREVDATGAGDSTDTDSQNRASSRETRIAFAFFHWLERQRLQHQLAAGRAGRVNTEDDGSSDEEGASEPSGTRSSSEDSRPARPEQSEEEPSASPLELLTEEYVAKVLSSAPRARQVMSYHGRRSCRTFIKSAVFWGRDFILSGSECSHVVVWNRWSGEPVTMFMADSAVVNRIAPHPRLPIIACSGIDRSVKIVEPDPSVFEVIDDPSQSFSEIAEKRQKWASNMCDLNTNHMRAALLSGSSFIERVARFRTSQAIRSVLRRLVTINQPSESVNPENEDNASSPD